MHPEISVVIPCYKEAEVIRDNIIAISEFLKTRFTRFEIIVVTDGSPDSTAEIANRLKKEREDIPLKVLSFTQNRGKGAAVRAGVLKSSFDPVMFIDADLTIPIEELETFFPALANADIVIASRLLSGSHFEEPTPWYRVLTARGFHILQMFLLGNFEFPDTQCGFKLFRRSAAMRLFSKLSIKRFAFDAELLFLAANSNMRVISLPVTIKKDPRNTNVSLLRDPISMFIDLIRIRFNQAIGYYSEDVIRADKKLSNSYWEIALIVLIIGLGIFLRAYHFSDWLHFEIDQSYDTLLVSPAVENGASDLPLLGPTSGGGRALRLGPAFYYMEYLSASIFGNTPVGHAMLVLMLSILSLPLFYLFSRRYFSRPISIGLLSIFSTSIYLVIYSRFSWSPNVLPFLILLSFYALLRSVALSEKHRERWFLIASGAIAITTQIHFNAFFVVPAITAAFLILRRPHFRWRTWIAAAGIFALLYAPVIASDIATHGQNLGYFFDKLSGGSVNSLERTVQKFSRVLNSDASEYFLITTGIDHINGKKLSGYGFSNNPSIQAWRIAAIILLAIELILLAAAFFRERLPERKDFLTLIGLWFTVSTAYFFSLSLHGYSLYPRFFLLVSPLAIILAGLFLERLGQSIAGRVDKMRAVLLIASFGLIAASNLWQIGSYFRELADSYDSPIRFQTEDVFPNTERITLAQEYAIADYIAMKQSENDYPVYIRTFHEFEPVIWYHLRQYGIDYSGKLDQGHLYREGNYFVITPAFDSPTNGDTGLTPYEEQSFGSLTVFSLLPPDGETALGDRQPVIPKERLLQEQQVSEIYTWRKLFLDKPGMDEPAIIPDETELELENIPDPIDPSEDTGEPDMTE